MSKSKLPLISSVFICVHLCFICGLIENTSVLARNPVLKNININVRRAIALVPISRLKAIVRLQNIELPPPKVSGEATLPIRLLEGGQVWTIDLKLGEKSARYLVDTGAATSMIATQLSRELNLKGTSIPGERVQFAVAGNDCLNMDATLYRLPTINAQTAQINDLMVLELSKTVIPDGLTGVLGMDFFRQFDLIINPQKQQLQLLSPSQLPIAEKTRAIPLQGKLGVMLAEVEINGKGPFTFLIDTGAESIFISQEVADKLAIASSKMQDISVQGFCGLEPAKSLTLDQVKMQNYQLNNLEAVVLNTSVLKVLAVDGILGQNFLNQFIQHWRFEQPVNGKFPERGSLVLTPLKTQ
ncbi:retroviral-like aspartic protease family protein [Phormidium sp. LEGE 05292]|uniref:retropepsin-like aspartic protease n=1 Tax=[Phormidium] sp. LEGE 05292 TaxID=767427 RepID=UPI00187E548B|nr:retropepsin-like aspartic protease [Phormidium sp. LEGE 05292]MBE9228234.1 retroviral-like aspartic protease family protein [Phormidium sp. LEGE 05292]